VSQIIERLLEVEKEARQTIAQADRQATQTIEDAHAEARRSIVQSREQTQAEARKLLDDRMLELQTQREERLAQEQPLLPNAESIDRRKLAKAVEFVVRTIAYGDTPAH